MWHQRVAPGAGGHGGAGGDRAGTEQGQGQSQKRHPTNPFTPQQRRLVAIVGHTTLLPKGSAHVRDGEGASESGCV